MAIETFTKPGQLVFDPHVGGGTTLVEARALGREGIGVDISPLAEFVARVKSTILSETELETLAAWGARLPHALGIHGKSIQLSRFAKLGYYKHLEHPSRWRLRKGVEQALASAIRLGRPRLEAFGRCVVLRAAQLALDGRSRPTGIDEFRCFLGVTAAQMVEGARELRAAVKAVGRHPVRILHRSAAGVEHDARLENMRLPNFLIAFVTRLPGSTCSIIVGRWTAARKHPLPFMIANKLDGAGSSYYTMGDRHYPELRTYFENIKATMSSVAVLANKRTVIMQMVAFSEPEWQLPRYLETMEQAGLKEMKLTALRRQGDGRLWRSVPGRRWYSNQRGDTPGLAGSRALSP